MFAFKDGEVPQSTYQLNAPALVGFVRLSFACLDL